MRKLRARFRQWRRERHSARIFGGAMPSWRSLFGLSDYFKMPGIGAKLYRGEKPPWEFDQWEWVDPADAEKHERYMRKNGYPVRT